MATAWIIFGIAINIAVIFFRRNSASLDPTRAQKMMWHQHYATTEIYVEEVQKLLKGAEEAVTQF
jgi:hypothetical protein